jgi:epoxyqueuosine reductase QueG
MPLYDEIINVFAKRPKILYGFSCIKFSEYKDQYKSALVYAVPHIKIMDIKSYNEEILDQYIIQACNEINCLQNEIENILLKYTIKYFFPSITQKDEQNLLAPISFKQLGINAGIGWIGKNDLLITSEYGPRVRLGAVLLDYDFPLNKKIMENNCNKNCMLCINSCPYKALKNKKWTNGIKRDEIINYKLCNIKRSSYLKQIGRKHSCGYCMVSCIYGLNKNNE